MKVYIAEKPKLGKAIATVLEKQSPRVDSGREFVAGKDWAVVWAAGHIFAQEEPDFYIAGKYPGALKGKNGKFSWVLDHLPILPGMNEWPEWRLYLDKEKAGLFKTIKQFVSKATLIVNAGDPDREGQLLIDEILHELGNKKPVRRVLISANDEVTVANGLKNERDNSEFVGLSNAGLARGRADWLCGMNFSRAATKQAQASGYAGSYVSIGRVQTPLLGLIVQRDLEIENFKPVDYFSLTALLNIPGVDKGDFTARWKPHEGQAGLDEEGRLLDRRIADQLNALVKGKTGKVIEYSDEEKQEGPPLPFSIDKLQIFASRKYGYTSDQVLKAAQALYDNNYTTYPRSDKSHLPVAQLAEAPAVVAAVTQSLSFSQAVLSQLDTKRKSRAWNDKKSTPHHGIIPTQTKANLSTLSPVERNLYDEICRRYLAQFLPNRRYRAVSATVDIAGQHFVASGTTTISPGWRVIYGAVEDSAEDDAPKGDENVILPPMKQGDAVLCNGLKIEPKKTTPPKHFTDGTLLEAMINIHKFVTDERVKAIFMKMLASSKGSGDEEAEGACGLGTPATRHTFVPKLIDVGFVERKDPPKGGKSKETFFISTPAGRAFIQAIPPELGKPDMTALWEAAMSEIEAGNATLDRFLAMQANWITKTIEKICAAPLKLPDPPGAKKWSGNSGSNAGTQRKPAEPAGKDCPKCGKPMMKRSGPKGAFFGCSGYPNCKHLENIEQG
ncbi:DNA topoisomerase 3 [Chromobacterium haemolyticum]|uniref:DNA topoisomerase 3 n=1 Tax=Chromobacterium haemolyticum TaxID=394935 RepID=UPI00244C8EC4|nr:DNA topoisomerase 3 [Chromobacterium haemolyticum]MDH0342035.1 DNA topoisomerase 3 [Chromobacterium haemolyticum]